jgi:hypothetical protein
MNTLPRFAQRLSLLSILAIAFACSSVPPARAEVNLARVDAELRAGGTMGFIHGRAAYPSANANAGVEYTVFTIREANDFFSHYEAPLVGATAAVDAQLRMLGRHDQIRVRGEFIANGAPVRHIRVREFDVVKRHDSGTLPPYEYQARIPDDLLNVSSFVGKVHAIAEGGRVLVVEYKDVVLPLFPRSPEWTRELFRGDTIRVYHKIRSEPQAPPHLMFDPAVANPLVRLHRIQDLHAQPARLTGTLAKFPKSPQIVTDVFALLYTNEYGITHDYTLANLEDPEVFRAIREKIAAVWDADAAHARRGRNQLFNPHLRVTANGTFNVVSADQANPQILLRSANDVTVEVVHCVEPKRF